MNSVGGPVSVLTRSKCILCFIVLSSTLYNLCFLLSCRSFDALAEVHELVDPLKVILSNCILEIFQTVKVFAEFFDVIAAWLELVYLFN